MRARSAARTKYDNPNLLLDLKKFAISLFDLINSKSNVPCGIPKIDTEMAVKIIWTYRLDNNSVLERDIVIIVDKMKNQRW